MSKTRRKQKKIGLITLLIVVIVGIGIIWYYWFQPEGYRLSENATSKGLEGKLTKTNKLLRDFPVKIPGAVRVDRYETPEAKYCLVHIRQAHAYSFKKFEEVEALERAWIIATQKDIYRILDYLWERNNKQAIEVYDEGYYPELANLDRFYYEVKKFGESTGKFSKIIEESNLLSHLKDTKIQIEFLKRELSWEEQWEEQEGENHREERIAELKKELEEARKKYERRLTELKEKEKEWEKIAREEKEKEFYYGTTSILEYEGKVITLPAETIDTAVRKREGDYISRVRYGNRQEDREDVLLGKIAEDSKPLALSVYGAAHTWGGRRSFKNYSLGLKDRASSRDNIAEWNKRHPDKKFSLIEITPINLYKL